MLAGAQLNQAAAATGAKLLGGSAELLDASVDQAKARCAVQLAAYWSHACIAAEGIVCWNAVDVNLHPLRPQSQDIAKPNTALLYTEWLTVTVSGDDRLGQPEGHAPDAPGLIQAPARDRQR